MKFDLASLAIGIGIGTVIAITAIVLLTLPKGNILEPTVKEVSNDDAHPIYPSIAIEMPKTSYRVGERLNFTIHTYGICAGPSVTIYRVTEEGEAITLYQSTASAFSCPLPERPDQPYAKWEAERLVQRMSDEIVGGDGSAIITVNAALTLKKTGNYTLSASLIDQSKSVSRDFSVMLVVE